MGIGGISVWQLLIVLAIVVLLFGTSRLRTIGGDLGSAVRGFRNSMQDTATLEEGESGQAEDADAGIVNARPKPEENPVA